MTTAPTRPPTTITAPSVPASVGVNPRGRMMFSIQVLTPLKIPRPATATASISQKGRTLRACLSPSKASARISDPGSPGGVGGFSRASTRNRTELAAATEP